MLFQRIKTPGLAHNSYILDCGDAAAVVVDPRRDVTEYLEAARQAGLGIRFVLETHRQEDFEYGSTALAQMSGARIVTGEHELFGRSDLRLKDGGELRVANTRFVALHTPGHTPESVCYAAYRKDAGEQCWAVFSGDALFVSETGRTDLADPARTAENAGLLYDTIHAKIAPLGDQALLYPAHGSGSACGGDIADRDESTLGIERHTNPVFTKSREAFVQHKISENLPRPPYFAHMERVNLEGGRPLPSPDRVRVLPSADFEREMKQGIVIDTRPPDAFAGAHIPGSYNIWLGGLATFGGWFAREDTNVFLVVNSPDDIESAVLSLARVGIDTLRGVLAGGIASWRQSGRPIARFETTSASEAHTWIKRGEAVVLDVRDDNEWSEGHIPGALHAYVGSLEQSLSRLPIPKEKRLVVHCSVGNRSGLAASILHRHGFENVYNMLGGIKAWRSLSLPLERSSS